VNPTDDQRLRQRLHEEFGALEISPPPVLRVTSRGQGLRTRRRALAIGGLVLVLAGGALSAHATGGQKAARPPTVTVSAPDPAAPGGVFASGTADGKRWALAVRNIAAAPGTRWCLPAVMVNGRDGDVLFGTGPRAPSFGNPALLRDIAGLPGVGFMFTQVTPGVTRLAAALSDGTQLTVRPVRVSACGQSFDLAGFAFAKARHRVMELDTYTRLGLDEGLPLTNTAGVGYMFGTTPPGVWANTDKSNADIAVSQAANPIGHGTVSGMTWHIRASLGLLGQCYTATVRGGPGGGRGQGSECVPVSAPPRAFALSALPVPSARTQLPGYAGLVNPRTVYLDASVSDGTTRRVVPVRVAGRAYVAIVVPAGCDLTWVSLFDASGRLFGQGRP
jgi:hypothetical protein